MKKVLALLLVSSLGFSQIPMLSKNGNQTKMMVDGKSFLILGSEMHNSTGTDTAAVTAVMKQAKSLKMNTVLGYAYWEMVEPVEGKFNFDLVDHLIKSAENENLKLILVWFGAWKSTTSSYTPEWVKTNPKRFERYVTEDGSSLEILTPFSDENLKADTKAYMALMNHLKNFDKKHTVIMLQPENEPGTFTSYRDFSPQAQKAWQANVPKEVINYLTKNKGKLFPAFESSWAGNGYKTNGTWQELFADQQGFPHYAEELFMAFHYSKFINTLATEGRKILDLPTYCNGWLYNKLGNYPHATINPHVLDMYRAGGDALDFYSPNVYSLDYDMLFPAYKTGGNPLFIPESILSPAGALYAIGEYDALGFAPYGIDGWTDEKSKTLLTEVNHTLAEMSTLITSKFNSPDMRGLYQAPMARNKSIEIGDYILSVSSAESHRFAIDFGKSLEKAGKETISFPQLMGIEVPEGMPHQEEQKGPPPNPFAGLPKDYGAAIIIMNNPDEFYIVGYGLRVDFALKNGISFNHLGYRSIDKGYFKNNNFIATKRWNGDELKVVLGEGELTVLKVRLYRN
jgi:beta-galactosidase GanA